MNTSYQLLTTLASSLLACMYRASDAHSANSEALSRHAPLLERAGATVDQALLSTC